MSEATENNTATPASEIENPYNAVISERIDLNPELALFRIKFKDGTVPEFEPGQFATLGLLPSDEEIAADKAKVEAAGPFCFNSNVKVTTIVYIYTHLQK